MPKETIYEELGVPHVVNATGTKTRIGGSRIRPEAVEAMAQASEAFVRLSDLQARASELIADVTGADAGYVTCGASSALALGAAACMAGDDIGAMARLPETEDVPDEIVMPRTHRTGYDHALRAAGARNRGRGVERPSPRHRVAERRTVGNRGRHRREHGRRCVYGEVLHRTAARSRL